MAIEYREKAKFRPRGESTKMAPETIRDLADQVAAKEKMQNPSNKKKLTSIRYDEKVLTYFQAQGIGWQTKMNNVLLEYVERQLLG
jgi:uncharacterized protein (DUF4415 family)